MDDKSHAGGRRNGLAQEDRVSDREDIDVPAGTAALAKGLTLLDLIADAKTPLRFADMMRASGLPKPTFSRILRTLIAFRLVRQDQASGTYTLGHRVMELSHRVWESFDLNAAALPELERLSAELGETVALCRLDGEQALYLEERSGDGLGVRVDQGRRVPLHCTAAGKALLAGMEPTIFRALVSRLTLDQHTPSTIVEPSQLAAEVTLTQARGYAVSYEEHLKGVNSVAAPLPGRDGTPLGAIVALGPSLRLDKERIHPVGRELIAAARRITGSAGTVAISSGPRPRSAAKSAHAIEVACVLPWGAQLGEAPVWVAREEKLYWVDILEPAVHRFDPVTSRNETYVARKLVSAILPAADGRLLVASQDGIETFDFDGGRFGSYADPEAGLSENRLNDAKVDASGAIWVGSMRLDASRPGGSLYRIRDRQSVERMETGITVSNGMGWSPDGQTFYFVDTVPGVILAYDVADGGLANRRVFAQIPENSGRPDGLTIDSDGGVWCAIWDGWRVDRFLPDGKLDLSLPVPVPRPTSIAFGGKDLDTLFITSARTRLPASTLTEAPLSGGLFACSPGKRGLPVHLFTPEGGSL
ncbi:SMP-30/gluconolactonase/LRE family protein [Rhizobium sp. NTR19]|uniref:SMP-30/gluconolactonase/LRE family protein n=1 Tax=Neorhizobium turbinariae TaxID=2937795 RepID=A0ABT0IWN2_9HYPH|nr:SMP-30/gluconolactonase/LRE family protein [Neorhizobium turbinariae]MCK8782294.1 SMP-30/gluconolactonase/LRE family protein [Neorhizobium turbinariae]